MPPVPWFCLLVSLTVFQYFACHQQVPTQCISENIYVANRQSTSGESKSVTDEQTNKQTNRQTNLCIELRYAQLINKSIHNYQCGVGRMGPGCPR